MLVLTLSLAEHTSVVSLKNVTKVVWYILVQSNSLNNTVSMVSGVPPEADQVSEDREQRTDDRSEPADGSSDFSYLNSVIRFLSSDTRHLKPINYNRVL
jgi:hypothetical protein